MLSQPLIDDGPSLARVAERVSYATSTSGAVGPPLGGIADIFSLQATFRIAGLGLLVSVSLVLFFLKR